MRIAQRIEADFTPWGSDYECNDCAALVTNEARERHLNWHDRLDERLYSSR